MSTEIVKHETEAMDVGGAPIRTLGHIGAVIKLAADKTVDLARVEKALAIQERAAALQKTLYAEAGRATFNRALRAVQQEAPTIGKDGEVKTKTGVLMYRYSTPRAIQDALDPLLDKYGFSYTVENTELSGGQMKCSLTLRHDDGHEQTFHFNSPLDRSGGKEGPQSAASTVSFCERHLLIKTFRLRSDEDIGEGQPAEPTITDEQVMKLETLIKDTGARLSNILQFAGVDSLDKITASKYNVILQKLMARRGK